MIGWLGCGIVLTGGGTFATTNFGAALVAHLRLGHVCLATRGSHHGGSAGAGEASLDLDALKILLVLELLFHVLVALEQLVVLNLALLESLVHASLNLLAKGVHLVGLFLNQSCLGSNDLLVALLHVAIALLILHLLSLNLDLMSFSILLLSCKLTLNGLKVQKFSGKLEG